MATAEVDTAGEALRQSRAASRAEAKAIRQELDPYRWRYRVGSLLVAIAAFGLWELIPRSGLVSYIILPPASQVANALYTLVTADYFMKHFLITLGEIWWGFLAGTIIGLTLGILLAVVRPLKRLTYPFVVAFQAIPKIVLAPLFIAWFGFGQSSKIVMAIAMSFFPLMINTMVGIENIPGDTIRLMQSLRASRWQIFRKVELPGAAPLIFAGVQVALTFALVGAIVGEFVSASQGMGYLLDSFNFQLKIDRVFAVIIILSALGAVFYFTLEWLDKKLIYWRPERGV